VSEKGCGRVALLSGRTITLAMGVPACPREHHGALGARVSRILSRLRCLDHLTAILIGVGSGVFIIAAGRIFRQIIVVHTASAANRRLVSTADSRYLALPIRIAYVCTGHDANTLYCYQGGTLSCRWGANTGVRCMTRGRLFGRILSLLRAYVAHDPQNTRDARAQRIAGICPPLPQNTPLYNTESAEFVSMASLCLSGEAHFLQAAQG
jgi:hypothetical protein